MLAHLECAPLRVIERERPGGVGSLRRPVLPEGTFTNPSISGGKPSRSAVRAATSDFGSGTPRLLGAGELTLRSPANLRLWGALRLDAGTARSHPPPYVGTTLRGGARDRHPRKRRRAAFPLGRHPASHLAWADPRSGRRCRAKAGWGTAGVLSDRREDREPARWPGEPDPSRLPSVSAAGGAAQHRRGARPARARKADTSGRARPRATGLVGCPCRDGRAKVYGRSAFNLRRPEQRQAELDGRFWCSRSLGQSNPVKLGRLLGRGVASLSCDLSQTVVCRRPTFSFRSHARSRSRREATVSHAGRLRPEATPSQTLAKA